MFLILIGSFLRSRPAGLRMFHGEMVVWGEKMVLCLNTA
jgi:hypothetical protein